MVKKLLKPDYIFESSWEVCNKVGGIYTVLSTRAKTLQEAHHDQVIFIGPGLWKREDGNYSKKESPYFREDQTLFADWQRETKENGLQVRVGRWTVPGEPIAILVDFVPYFEKKNELYFSNLQVTYDFTGDWLKKVGLKKLVLGIGTTDLGYLSSVRFERGTSYPYCRTVNLIVRPTF